MGVLPSHLLLSESQNALLLRRPILIQKKSIDGVLLHVATPIRGATETLRYLDDHGIPFILLTNGGGRLEEDRVRELSQKLDVPLTKANFIQSHTPFQGLVHGPQGLKDKNILVTGANAEKCRHIAEHYGFRNVITPGDILVAEPKVWPFDPLLESVYQSTARPLPAPIFHPARAALARSPSTALKIDAIFVFNDPRDWALDIQLITDLLLSEQGYLGTFSAKNGDSSLPNHGYQQDGQPSLYFSNADLFWATGFQMPRLGQGAFQAAVAGVWSSVTSGQELRRNVIGKPYSETYVFAEKVLHEHRHEMLMRQGDVERPSKLERVWMIGDNPASDVAGANLHSGANGTTWEALLVRTGVFNPERQSESSLRDQFAPRRVLDDVRGAVRWALEQEGWDAPQKLV